MKKKALAEQGWIRKGCALHLILLTVFLGLASRARAQDDAAITSHAAAIERGLCSPLSYFDSLDRLISNYRMCQHIDLIVAPPDPNCVYTAAAGAIKVFDPSGGFPSEMLAGLVATNYNDLTYAYKVTLCQDRTNFDYVVLNGEGVEVYREAPPAGYDPWCYLRAVYPWALQPPDSERAQWLRGIYDYSRIRRDYLLVTTNDLPSYAMALASQMSNRALVTSPSGMSAMTMQSMAPVTALTFTACSIDTNWVSLEVALPEGYTNLLGLFARSNLVSGSWGFLQSTNTSLVPNPFVWVVPADANFLTRFFMLHDLGYSVDSDGDGMPDWWEVMYGFDPFNASDAMLDTDGDGVDNLTEYLQGRDPTKGVVPDTNQQLNLSVFTPLE